MIIAISGFTGSGKNTLGELLSKELGYAHICPTFKDLARKEGVSLMEFHKKAEKDQNIDKKFDKFLVSETKRGDCVVTTWLGPWVVDADIRIRLIASETVRAGRVAKRDNMNSKEALEHLRSRDDSNRKRYKKIYNIDIDNIDMFDACLNSGLYNPKQLLGIVIKIINEKRG